MEYCAIWALAALATSEVLGASPPADSELVADADSGEAGVPARIEALWRDQLKDKTQADADREVALLKDRYIGLLHQLDAITDSAPLLKSARNALLNGSISEAERALLQYLDKRQRQAGHDPAQLAEVLFQTAQVHLVFGRIADAHELFLQAALQEPENRLYMAYLMETYLSGGQLEAGLTHYQHHIDTLEGIPGASDDLANAHSDMGFFLDRVGRYDDAWVHHRAALDIVGPDSSGATASIVYCKIGSHYNRVRDYAQAATWLDKGASIFQAGAYASASAAVILYVELAIAHDGIGNHERARQFATQGVSLAERTLGPRSPELGSAYFHAGAIMAEQDQPYEAVELYLRAHEVFIAIYGADATETADVSRALGQLWDAHEQYDLALQWFDVALSAYKVSLGDDARQTIGVAMDIGEVFYVQDQFGSAATFFAMGADKLVAAFGPTQEVGRRLSLVSRCYEELGDPVNAVKYLQLSLEIGLDGVIAESPEIAVELVVHLAGLYDRASKFELALDWLDRIDHLLDIAAPDDRVLARAYRGKALLELGRTEDAREVLLRAVEDSDDGESENVAISRSIAFDFLADLHETRGEYETALRFALNSVTSYRAGGAQPADLASYLERVRLLEHQLERPIEPVTSSCACASTSPSTPVSVPLFLVLGPIGCYVVGRRRGTRPVVHRTQSGQLAVRAPST